MSKLLFNKRTTPVPGIQIDLTMLSKDGVFISIENDCSPEVASIYLPDVDFIRFAEYVNEAISAIKENGNV